jgi:hypothetical protein
MAQQATDVNLLAARLPFVANDAPFCGRAHAQMCWSVRGVDTLPIENDQVRF